MFHYVNAITNTKGDALIGYYVKLTNAAGDIVSIYADNNSTPIVAESGVANAAEVDSNGNVSFYVPSGEYNLDIYATDGATLVNTIPAIPMVDVGVIATSAPTRAELSARTPTDGDTATLTEKGREGLFVFSDVDLEAEVAADVNQGLYVAPDSDDTGASGAWVRKYDGAINAFWFMAETEIASVQAFDYSVNVTLALQAASALIQFMDGGNLLLPPGGYLVGLQTFQGTLLDGVTDCAYGPQEVITIKNCAGTVKISGYGAILKAADGLRYGSFDPVTGDPYASVVPFSDYDYYAYPYRAMINLEGNAAVLVEGVELNGNSANMEIGGEFGDSNWQVEGHGIWDKNNGSVTVRDVHAHHQPGDGIVRTYNGLTEASASTPFLYENVKARFNGRLGMSITGSIGGTLLNCDLSQTGQVMNTSLGALLQTSPGCGIDVEAEGSIVRDVQFINCNMVSNFRYGFIAASGNSKRIKVLGGKIESAICARPMYHFDSVTFIGRTNFSLAAIDQYTALTITKEDGFRFSRCHFCYDATLTETGTIQNSTQSDWDEALFSTWDNCTVHMGANLLPSAYKSPLASDSMVFRDCDFSSTYSGAGEHSMCGYFHGRNTFTLSDTLVQQIGTASEISYGEIYVNGAAQSGDSVAVTGSITTSGTGGIGYSTGAGGTVTQAGAKSNTVVLNEVCGQITMHNASLAADTATAFVLTNSTIAATDLLVLNVVSGGTAGAYALNGRITGAGAAVIDVRNLTAGALGEAIVIGFAVIKAVTA
jgi:hypothetical protein